MTQEALKLALEALEMYGNRHRATYLLDGAWDEEITLGDKAITAIKEALAKEKTLQALHSENKRLGLYKEAYAQPEQEPVAYLCEPDANGLFGLPTPDKGCKDCFPVYRHSQRTWVGLTMDEIALLHANYPNPQGFALALQAKLRERNT